jgi:RimJ/RimL family protein N-acetyltransferase
MNLVDIYTLPDRHQVLYDLLKERDETTNINHRELPEWWQHVSYVESHPYDVWNFIEVGGQIVGHCYITTEDEIGIFVFREHQGKHYGPAAVRQLMFMAGKRKYKAHINPRNERSASLFARLGFTCKQHTYELSC